MDLNRPSISKISREIAVIQTRDGWMQPQYSFLINGTHLEDKSDAQKIRMKSSWFAMIDGKLYQKSIFGPLLHYLTKVQRMQVLREIQITSE